MHDKKLDDFCLQAISEMYPNQDEFETLSEPIPDKRVLHITSFSVTCDPVADSASGEYTRVRVEVFWRDFVDGEIVDHPIDLIYAGQGQRTWADLSHAMDGTPLVGDGKRVLGIRRRALGIAGPQESSAVVRGFIH